MTFNIVLPEGVDLEDRVKDRVPDRIVIKNPYEKADLKPGYMDELKQFLTVNGITLKGALFNSVYQPELMDIAETLADDGVPVVVNVTRTYERDFVCPASS